MDKEHLQPDTRPGTSLRLMSRRLGHLLNLQLHRYDVPIKMEDFHNSLVVTSYGKICDSDFGIRLQKSSTDRCPPERIALLFR